MAVTCRFPRKQQLTERDARGLAARLNRERFDGHPVCAYRCKAGPHWHVGHPARHPTRRRKPR